MLSYFLLGLAIGALTGVPIGPVNVAVIDAAYRHHVKRAISVGIGGAIADFLYSLLGILGMGPILVAHPNVPPILYAVSGVVLVVYGILTVRSQPVDPTGGSGKEGGPYFWSGLGLGAALILLNPATLVTWVVIVGSQLAGVNRIDGCAAALGIGLGSAAWFTFVSYLADHGKKVLGQKAVWITRIVGFALIGYGVFSMGRAAYYLVKHVG